MERLHRLYCFMKHLMRRMRLHGVDAYSAQAAFFLFLSLFPTAFLLLPLLRFLPEWQVFSGGEVTELVPKAVSQLMASILQEMGEKTNGTIIGISALTAFWSAGRGLYALMRGFTAVYSLNDRRSYLKLRMAASLYTLLFLALVLGALALLVFGNQIYRALGKMIPGLPMSAGLFRLLTVATGFVLFVVIFLLLYWVVPHCHLPWRVLLPGSVVSALGWMLFSVLFSVYIDRYANYANLYGSLTAVVVLMLWLYFCMYILFVGAELNCMLQAPMLLYSDKRRIKRAESKCKK